MYKISIIFLSLFIHHPAKANEFFYMPASSAPDCTEGSSVICQTTTTQVDGTWTISISPTCSNTPLMVSANGIGAVATITSININSISGSSAIIGGSTPPPEGTTIYTEVICP